MSTLHRALRVFPLFLSLLLFPTIAVHAASEPLVIPGEPEWLGSRQISTDDGHAPLDWALDEEKEYAELYLLEEEFDNETRTSYLAESELHVYRVQAGRYRFRVAGCVRTPEGVPECGPFSKELKLTVPEQVQAALLDEEALPEKDPQQGLVGGPDDLRPGLWHDPSFGGQGWSFYWANRLALPASDPDFGNAYDLYGIWYTFEAKSKIEEDPDDCPNCPVRYRDYRPVVLTLKAVKTGSDVYGGGLYVTRNGVETQIGSANLGFGGGNTQASVTWTGVTFLKGERLSGNFSLQLLTGSDPGDFNNVSHLGGLWNNAANDDYFVVNDIGATSETVYVIFEDDNGDPVWLLGSRSGSPVSSNTNFCLSYLNRGRRPNSAGSPSYVWHDSGCDSTQVATTSNRNSRREFIGFNQQRIWANFTLPGSSMASGSIVLGTSASPKSLQKRASFHGIDYDYAGGNSCEMTTAVPRCTVQLTWFTDGDYPNATAYMRKTGGGRTRIKTSTDPAMLNQPWSITDEGTYTFELRMGNSASSTLIAQSNTFTVTSSVVANPPPRPIALHGLWWVPEDKKYYVRWAQKAAQDVSEFRLQEVRPNGSSTTYTGIAGASNAQRWFDKSSSAQGLYRYRVRACNEAGCSAWTPYMDWYTVDRSLQNIYVRDFESSAGWRRNPNGTDGALTGDQGRWTRGNPVQVSLNGVIYQLGTTVSGSNAMVTARGAGTTAWIKEVDNGAATVRSSKFTLPACTNGCLLRFHYYLAHNNTGRWEDAFRVHVVKPNGGTEQLAEDRGKAQNRPAQWRQASVDLTRFAGQQIQLLFEARDGTNADAIVEAGIDDVKVVQVVNSSPVIANPENRSHRNGDSVSFTVGVSDADDPVSSLTLGASGQPNNIAFTPGTRRFSGTVNATVGSRTVTVTADDPHGGHDAESFTWTVLNSSPVLTSPGNKSHDEGQSVSFHLSASDVDPGQSLIYAASNLPPGLAIIGSSGRIHGTIQSGARSGSPYTVTVSANDGQGGTNSKSFTWTVSGNDAPAISNPGNQSYEEGQSVTLDLNVVDDPADTLSCSDGNTLPSNLSVAVHNNDKCRITGTLQAAIGDYPVTITVSDGQASDSASFSINVQVASIEFEYDARGRLIKLENSGQEVTTYTLDDAGNRVEIERD